MQQNTEHFWNNIFICIFYSEVQAVRSPCKKLGAHHLFNKHAEINYCLKLRCVTDICRTTWSHEQPFINIQYTSHRYLQRVMPSLCQYLQIHNNMTCITHYLIKTKKIYILSSSWAVFFFFCSSRQGYSSLEVNIFQIQCFNLW